MLQYYVNYCEIFLNNLTTDSKKKNDDDIYFHRSFSLRTFESY